MNVGAVKIASSCYGGQHGRASLDRGAGVCRKEVEGGTKANCRRACQYKYLRRPGGAGPGRGALEGCTNQYANGGSECRSHDDEGNRTGWGGERSCGGENEQWMQVHDAGVVDD